MRKLLMSLLLIPLSVQAEKIQPLTFEVLLKRTDNVSYDVQPQAFEQQLAESDKYMQIVLLNRYLANLAKGDGADPVVRQWVADLTDDVRYLSVIDPDHPQRNTQTINIARAAKTVLSLWDMKAQADNLNSLWRQGYTEFLTFDMADDSLQSRALDYWLRHLGEDDLTRLRELLLSEPSVSSQVTMATLAALYERSADLKILDLMLARDADHHVVRAVNLLPQTLSSADAVDALSLALDDKALQSQALLLLAKHYSSQPKAQVLLHQALNKDELGWHAASVLRYVADPAFKRALSKSLADSKKPQHQFARQVLEQEAQL